MSHETWLLTTRTHGGITNQWNLLSTVTTLEGHLMSIEGYVEYKRREYCKDVKCPVQLELDASASGSDEYERIRAICQQDCRHTTYEFHHWLIEKGYLIVRPEK